MGNFQCGTLLISYSLPCASLFISTATALQKSVEELAGAARLGNLNAKIYSFYWQPIILKTPFFCVCKIFAFK